MKDPDYSSLQKHVLSHRIFESELHGIEHWKQVERNGLLLATETGADVTIVRLFALFHDSKRADDGFDKEHGPRGAEFAKTCFEEHRFDITQEQFDKLYHACKFHTTEPRSGDATIDTATMPTASTWVASASNSTPTRWQPPSGQGLLKNLWMRMLNRKVSGNGWRIIKTPSANHSHSATPNSRKLSCLL